MATITTGIKFTTRVKTSDTTYSNILSDVYYADKIKGQSGKVISFAAGVGKSFVLKSPGCDDLTVTVDIVTGKITSKTFTMARYWKPLSGTVWKYFNPYQYVSCDSTSVINNGYIQGNVCSFNYNLVINFATNSFDVDLTALKTKLSVYINGITSEYVTLIKAVVFDSQYDSKVRELLTAYKLKLSNETDTSSLTLYYQSDLKSAQAKWQWYIVGCYRDKYSLLGNSVYLYDTSAESKFNKAVAVIQGKLNTFMYWLYDYIASSADQILIEYMKNYVTTFDSVVDAQLAGITTEFGFVDSTDLRTQFDDVTTAFNKFVDDQYKLLTDVLGMASGCIEQFIPLRESANTKFTKFLTGDRAIIRLLEFNVPQSINWSGVNRFSVRVTNVGGKVFNGWFQYKFVDSQLNEYLYNRTPSPIPSVLPGDTITIDTDISFSTLFPNGSVGQLRVKLIPVRSD
jgi:hypothetical protein